jgi:hypothetical protein
MTPHGHNLLAHDQLPHVRRRRRAFLYALYGLLAAIGLAVAATVALFAVSIGPARDLYAGAQAGREALFAAKDAAERLEFEIAGARLDEAAAEFARAREASDRLGLAARLPFFHEDLEGISALLEGGHEAAVALREALDVGMDLLSVLHSSRAAAGAVPDPSTPLGAGSEARAVSDLTREEKRQLLAKLKEAPDRLGLARAALDRALAAFDRVPRTGFTAGILDALAPHRTRLEELRVVLSQDLSLLASLPSILGYPEPKTYLFLLLNNTEIRPGGGFIGTYGIVKLADGEVESFFTDDVYALDGPAEAYLKETPPEPLRTYLRADGWFMRDANWSPDFVASAMNVERFYRLEGGKERLDGVIGVTPTVISKLLAMTGPITVDGSTFTAGNVVDELEYKVEIAFTEEGIPKAQRKDIVGKLGQELLKRLFSLPLSQLSALAQVADASLKEKHLLAAFKDPSLQALSDARKWSGRLEAGDGDRLAVIDANLASLKSDPVVRRTVAYSLRPEGDSWVARAAVTYRNTGRFTWKTTRYRTYTRFYVPIGSALLKGEGAMLDDKLNDPQRRPGVWDVDEDLGRTVFGSFVSIEPGETRTLAVEYEVSDAVARMIRSGRYDLLFQKQLGTEGHGLTLDLGFGKNVVRATPAEDAREWGDAAYRFSTDLKVDRKFTIDLRK